MRQVNCPDCGKAYKLPAQVPNKLVGCRACGATFELSALVPSINARSDEPKPEPKSKPRPERQPKVAKTAAPPPRDPGLQILELLDNADDLPRPRVAILHRIVALFVACVMLVLPLFYLAFIAGVAWITWWHATHSYQMWVFVPGVRATVFLMILYVALIVMGVMWTLSLIKPLFMRLVFPPDDGQGVLKRKDEPLLFAFADRLADKVGSPRPDVIRVQLDVNATASYDTALFGLVRKSFTLSLGVPLVAGLTLSQLAGVMAHEFGHFSQRGSTLLQRLIRRINMWFAFAVYREDAIDTMIASMVDEGGDHPLLALVAFVMWILVWLGRGVLWVLMMIGLGVSSALLRRQEFDADRYQIGLIGSNGFEETMERVMRLSVAHVFAAQQVFNSLRGDHLPADFPGFVVALADESKRVKKKTRKLLDNEQAGLLSSHPAMRTRIRAAEKLDLPGVFHSKQPGSALFKSFRRDSKQLSSMLYEARFGDAYTPNTRRSTEEAIEIYMQTMEGRKSRAEE